MSKGISDAQKAKEKLWTDADTASGKISNIQLMDKDNNYSDRKTAPVYARIEIKYTNGVTATVPCTLAEAEEYSIGQTASIELDVDDGDEDD